MLVSLDLDVSRPPHHNLFVDWREDGFKSYLLAGSAGRFIGLWACICQAMFAYSGAELIGIAADETERQRETLPKAVRRVSYRIVFYYVGCVVVLGLNVSAQDPVLASYVSTGSYTSPFELMVRRAGIPGLAHVINVVALIAVTSVANANLYVSVCSLNTELMVESNLVCACDGETSSKILPDEESLGRPDLQPGCFHSSGIPCVHLGQSRKE